MAYDSDRGVVVLFGGMYETWVNDTWEWDGVSWRRVGASSVPPSPRSHAAMAYDQFHHKTVLFGGWHDNGVLDDTWEWDGEAETWVEQTPTVSPSGRAYSAAAFDRAGGRNVTVLFGGWTGVGLDAYGDTWTWDGTEWTTRTPANSPAARSEHGMAYHAALEEIVLFGGDNGGLSFGDTWVWDGSEWHEAPTSGPGPRTRVAMAYDEDHELTVLFGGLPYLPSTAYKSDTWEWDGVGWTEMSTSHALGAVEADLAYAGDGLSLLIGYHAFSHYRTALGTFLWDGASWSKVPCDVVGPPSSYAEAAFDPVRDVVVLFGGLDACGNLSAQTWEWDGVGWRNVSPPSGPSARYGHAIAFDPVTERVLLFGGSGTLDPYDGQVADTWLWDGESWTEQTPVNIPPGRTFHAMATYPGRGVVMGGGDIENALTIDLWEWNGSDWADRSSATAPPWRAGHTLVYDPLQGGLLLAGGAGLYGVMGITLFGDTWLWNGDVWEPLSPDSISARWHCAMALDPARSVTVLFGGLSVVGPELGTYVWAAGGWLAEDSGLSPPPMEASAMATAPGANGVLLHGGLGGPTRYGDTWLYSAPGMEPLGEPCEASSECASGFCTDGFCCDVSACVECRRCDASGTCSGAAPDGAACDDGDPCTSGEACSGATCEPGADVCEASGCGCRLPIPSVLHVRFTPTSLLSLAFVIGLALRHRRRQR